MQALRHLPPCIRDSLLFRKGSIKSTFEKILLKVKIVRVKIATRREELQ
jgi:hypothetical protein